VSQNHREQSRGQKPAWNSNVRRKTAAPVTQSNRDPMYEQRRERRLERQRELLAQVAANDRLIPRRFVSRERQQQNADTDEREMMQMEHGKQRRQTSPYSSPSPGLSLCHFTLAAAIVVVVAVGTHARAIIRRAYALPA